MYFSWRNSIVEVTNDHVRIGKRIFPFADHMISLDFINLPLGKRPLTSLWKKSYDIIKVIDKDEGVECVPLELTKSERPRLENALDRATWQQ